jgi:hypothetical protein
MEKKPKKWVAIVATLVWLFFAMILTAFQFVSLPILQRLLLGIFSLFFLWLALLAPVKTRIAAILALSRAKSGRG